MNLQKPTLEEYGLDEKLYEKYRLQNKDLNSQIFKLKHGDSGAINAIFGILGFFFIFYTIYGITKIGDGNIIPIATSVLFWVLISLFINQKHKKDEIKEKHINKEITKIHYKVGKFEKAVKTYLQHQLESFFIENLYKKHSNTERYQDSLNQMSVLVSDVKKVNDQMLFEKVHGSNKYLSYVQKKEEEIGFNNKHKHLFNDVPIRKKQEISKQINSQVDTPVIEDVPGEDIKVEITPKEPQTPFGRKIDWDEVNKHRRELGNKGEEIVYALEKSYLFAINRKDLAEKVKHTSKDIGDGLGYDILSFDEKGEEKYIEVKSTSRSESGSFNISQNELNFLKSNKDKAHIYRVLNVDSEEYEPFVETYTADEVLSGQIEPTQFRVKVK